MMGMMWGHCGDNMGTMWGQYGDHGDMGIMWGGHKIIKMQYLLR